MYLIRDFGFNTVLLEKILMTLNLESV